MSKDVPTWTIVIAVGSVILVGSTILFFAFRQYKPETPETPEKKTVWILTVYRVGWAPEIFESAYPMTANIEADRLTVFEIIQPAGTLTKIAEYKLTGAAYWKVEVVKK